MTLAISSHNWQSSCQVVARSKLNSNAEERNFKKKKKNQSLTSYNEFPGLEDRLADKGASKATLHHLSSTPGTHAKVAGENWLQKVVFWAARAHHGTPVITPHTHIHITHTPNKDKWNKGKKKTKCISPHKVEALAPDFYGRCTELPSSSLFSSNSRSHNRRMFGDWRNATVKGSDKQCRENLGIQLQLRASINHMGKNTMLFLNDF